MNELKKKIESLKKLEYSTIALDIRNLNRYDLTELKGSRIFEETNYLIFIARKGIEESHQAETLDNEVIDYIIKLK